MNNNNSNNNTEAARQASNEIALSRDHQQIITMNGSDNNNNNTEEEEESRPENVLVTCWLIVSSFLNFDDVVKMSMVCSSLRDLTINKDDRTVVATHLNVGGFHNDTFNYRPRNPYYQQHVLLSLCAPKAQVFKIKLQGSYVNGEAVDDAHITTFPMLVSILPLFQSLISFDIDICVILRRNPNDVQFNMQIFGKHIASLPKLNHLGIDTGGNCPYSDVVLTALTEKINKNDLLSLSLRIGSSKTSCKPSLLFLQSLLGAHKLERLNLMLYGDLANKLTAIIKSKQDLLQPLSLKGVGLYFGKTSTQDPAEILTFLKNSCSHIECFKLRVKYSLLDVDTNNKFDATSFMKSLDNFLDSQKYLKEIVVAIRSDVEDYGFGEVLVRHAMQTGRWTSLYAFQIGKVFIRDSTLEKLKRFLDEEGIFYEIREYDPNCYNIGFPTSN